jgi:hypothetical protein
VADDATNADGGSQQLIKGNRPKAWYSPTEGYIVWERHPIQDVMVLKRTADRRVLGALPADAAEFILVEPWRRFPTDNP